jgi:hypothetical protein
LPEFSYQHTQALTKLIKQLGSALFALVYGRCMATQPSLKSLSRNLFFAVIGLAAVSALLGQAAASRLMVNRHIAEPRQRSLCL